MNSLGRPAAVLPALLAWSLCWSGGGADLPEKYDRWLDEEVVYLISDNESKEFRALKTDEEREAFVKRFWEIRDPDPSTEENEFQVEHYRRIKEANRKFSGPGPGWRSPRGRVYIMHGPPDQIQFQAGLPFELMIRQPTTVLDQVASVTQTPMARVTFQLPESELWLYRHLDGARHVSGYFQVIFSRISRSALHGAAREMARVQSVGILSLPQRLQRDTAITRFLQQADAIRQFQVIYAGRYRFEGLADLYRGIFSPGRVQTIDFDQMIVALRDLEEPRGEVLERRLKLKQRLREEVSAQVIFDTFQMQLATGTVRADGGRTTVPVTLGLGAEYAGDVLDFLIELKRPDGSIAAGFADSLELESENAGDFLYQTRLIARPGRYRLHLYSHLKKRNAAAHLTRDVELPDYSGSDLAMSDVLLFRDVFPRHTRAASTTSQDSMPRFLGGSRPVELKDYILVPASDHRFRRRDNLTAFIEVYNPSVDGTRATPELDLVCRFWQGDRLVATVPEKSLQYMTSPDAGSEQKKQTSYGISIPLRSFRPGHYQLELMVADRIARQTLSRKTEFMIR